MILDIDPAKNYVLPWYLINSSVASAQPLEINKDSSRIGMGWNHQSDTANQTWQLRILHLWMLFPALNQL